MRKAAIVKRIVIDASVALKWELRDEEAAEQADALLENFLAGQLAIASPTLFDYEVANALKVAVARGRTTEAKAQAALADFRLYGIDRIDFPPFQDVAFQLALRHNRSVYDSAYLSLAQSLGVWLFTGDRRLFNAVGGALDWVKWIGIISSTPSSPSRATVRASKICFERDGLGSKRRHAASVTYSAYDQNHLQYCSAETFLYAFFRHRANGREVMTRSIKALGIVANRSKQSEQ